MSGNKRCVTLMLARLCATIFGAHGACGRQAHVRHRLRLQRAARLLFRRPRKRATTPSKISTSQIVRGQGSADAVKQVAAGTAQIGFADAAAVILGRGNDQIPVKIVAVVYAKPPHAIYVLKDSGISKPKDLEGKKLADTAFSAVPKLFDAYAKAANIDASKVTWLVASSDTLPGMLTTGRADGIGQFIVGEPLLAKSAAPKQVLALSYADAGLDLYGNGIIVSDALIKSNSDLDPPLRQGHHAGAQGCDCRSTGGRRNHEQASPRSRCGHCHGRDQDRRHAHGTAAGNA